MRTILELGPRRIDLETGEVVGHGVLRPMERALLAYLTTHRDRVVSIHEMHVEVWGYSASVISRAAYITISRLRRLVDPDSVQPRFVRAHRGEGYRLHDARLIVEDDDRPTTLPVERTPFVGRDAELADLARRHDAGERLVTLIGPGGSGKTRLAIRHARTHLADWPGGVWFCDLSDARTLDEVFHAVTFALGASAGGDAAPHLGRVIAARDRCLVVLDNFEQVAEHAAATVGRWLDDAPAAAFLVTSRERLLVAGERAVALDPLIQADAQALFLQCAEAARPGIALGPDAPVEELVDLLDRLPLAIELAAARLRMLSVDDVLARMSDRFRMLATPGRTDRHATMRATLDASWGLLASEQRAALADLSVFEGGFDLAAAEAVLAGGDRWPIDEVHALVDHSLVQAGPDGRFHLLLTVQAYAREQLEGSGGADAAERRHGAWFSREVLGPSGRRIGPAEELANLIAACRRAIDRGDGRVAVGALVRTLAALEGVGPYRLGRDLADQVLALAELTRSERSRVLGVTAILELWVGRIEESARCLDTAIDVAREGGDRTLEVLQRIRRGAVRVHLGRLDDAQADLFAALPFLETDLDAAIVAANLALAMTDPGERERWTRLSLERYRAAGDAYGVSQALADLANLRRGHPDGSEEAESMFREALAIGSDRGIRARNLVCLAAVLADRGRADEAREALSEALVITRAVGMRGVEAKVMVALGEVAAAAHDASARGWWEAALAIQREVGDPVEERVTLALLEGLES